MKFRKMKWLCFLLCIAILAVNMQNLACADVKAPEKPETVAEGYAIYDVTDDKVIMEKNGDHIYYPASTTKIMTALLVCENVEDLDQKVSFPKSALDEMTSDSSTLHPIAQAGEKFTVRQMLMGMLLVSSNECAAALGQLVAGTTEKFSEMMTERAKEMGCKNTNFKNAHGLHDDDHYTTPEDLALIMGEALKNPVFFEAATTTEYTIPATNMCTEKREMENGHSIVNGIKPYPEVFAGKTGRTPIAGRTLVTAAQFNGHTVVVVIMKSTDDAFYDDTFRLLEYARGYYDGKYTDMTWKEDKKERYVVNTNSLMVRDYPSTKGTTAVARLEFKTKVEQTATWGDWSQILYNGKYYYVNSAYLSDKKPSGDYDPNDIVKETTRAEIDPVIPGASESESVEKTTENDTLPSETEPAAQSSAELYETTVSGGEGEALADDETTASEGTKWKKNDMTNGTIKVVMVVCLVLMVLVAAAYFMTSSPAKMKRKNKNKYRTKLK